MGYLYTRIILRLRNRAQVPGFSANVTSQSRTKVTKDAYFSLHHLCPVLDPCRHALHAESRDSWLAFWYNSARHHSKHAVELQSQSTGVHAS